MQGSVLTFAGLAAEIARRADYAGRRLSALQRERVLERVARPPQPRCAARIGGRGRVRRGGRRADRRAPARADHAAAPRRSRCGRGRRRTCAGRRLPATSGGSTPTMSASSIGSAGSIASCSPGGRSTRCGPRRRAGGATPVFFYGFDDLTALERDAIETLARVVGVAGHRVADLRGRARGARRARAEAVEELRPLAESVTELPAQDEHYAPESRRRAAPPRALPVRARRASGSTPAVAGVTLLEAGGERAEAELVAAHVLELRRAGVPASEIVVVYRSRERAAPLLAPRVRPVRDRRSAVGRRRPFGHTPLGRAVLGAARCALDPEAARRRGPARSTCAPPACCTPPRSPTRWRPRSAAAACAPPRRPGSTSAGRLTSSMRSPPRAPTAAIPDRRSRRLARRLLAAPVSPPRAAARRPTRRSTPGRWRRCTARSTSSAELGLRPPAAELIELLAASPSPVRAGVAGGEVLLAEPARDPRAPVSARCSSAGCRRASSRGRPAPSRSSPTSAAGSWRVASGLRLRPREDALAGERYLFYAAVSRATERSVSRLSQLRRGGQPGARLAVRRRRRRAAGRGLALAPAPAAARRRRVGAGAGADRARARARARGRAAPR